MPAAVQSIDLASPFSEASKICALSGGASYTSNLHRLSSALMDAQNEVHSVDFVKHDAKGNRTKRSSLHPQPQDIEDYLAFDEPIYAPCAGEVVAAENGKPDHPAGSQFRDTSGSNYVTLRCDGIDIVLAHLKQGSLNVRLGEEVRRGKLLGKVGHSGNTEEPHLHINAQSVPDDSTNYEAPKPVVMTFQGEYLSRGDCL